jgi:predicted O-linked N-acetylglucosamine transferase (SPINDLY family)
MSNTLINVQKKLRQGKLGEAHKLIVRALKHDPDNPELQYQFGVVLLQQNRVDEALEYLRQAVSSGQAQPCWYVQCGVALMQKGMFNDAEKSFRLAEMSGCNDERMYLILGNFHTNITQDFTKAEIYYTSLIKHNPNIFDAYLGLSALYIQQQRYEEAIQALDYCLTHGHETAEVYVNLCKALSNQGRQKEALTCISKAIEINPDHLIAKQNYIAQLVYTIDDQSVIFREIQKITRSLNKHARRRYLGPVDRQTGRKLRLGFVSADLRHHAIAFYFKPILELFDKNIFYIHFYYNNFQYDKITNEIREEADGWCECHLLSDEQLYNQIRSDKIDILIDLSNHTFGNRLTAFNLRPAPMQVAWLGLPVTTGMSGIDFALRDSSIVEICELDKYSSEKILPVEDLIFFKPLFELPPLSEPPCVKNGFVTFGSFNVLRKVYSEVLETWAKLLHNVPESKIRMVIDDYENTLMRDHIHDIFAKYDVDKSCVYLHPRLQLMEYLDSHREVDIALDPYPYHGQTTSFNSLLMGLPLVSRSGKSAASNISTRILSAIGRQQWIARDFNDYIDIASSLAQDTEQLVSIRRSLRNEVQNSSIMDYRLHAQHIEAALLEGWRMLYGAGNNNDMDV